MKQSTRNRLELSAIFLAAMLLLLSLISLCGKAAATQSQSDPFPGLYATGLQVAGLGAKTVYLTFDDGPSTNTERILDIMKERGIKGTFFVTAQEDDRAYLDLMLQRIVQEGHTLGLHTYSHDYSEIYAYPNAYLKDIDALRKLVEEAVDYKPSILRFPGGSATSNASRETITAIQRELQRRGYVWYDWDIPTNDSSTTLRSSQEIAQTIIDGVLEHNGGIILCHDNRTPTTTPEGVAIAIDTLMPMGYRFEALPSHVVE